MTNKKHLGKVLPLVIAMLAALLTGTSAAADDVTPMIVNGDDAKQSWAVSFQSAVDPELGLPDQDGLWPSCGGVLIAAEWVVTANHCPKEVLTYAKVGGLNWREGNLVRVAQVIPHKGYDPMVGAQYDIALVKLAKPVTNVKPVPIGFDGGENSLSLVQGWGTMCDIDPFELACHEDIPDNLQQLWLKQLPGDRCEFPGEPAVFHQDSMLCMVSADGQNRQACFGDSGGPILRMVGTKVYVIAIVTGDADSYSEHANLCSTAQSDGSPGKLMVTKLSSYVPWIITTITKWEYCQTHRVKNKSQCELVG